MGCTGSRDPGIQVQVRIQIQSKSEFLFMFESNRERRLRSREVHQAQIRGAETETKPSQRIEVRKVRRKKRSVFGFCGVKEHEELRRHERVNIDRALLGIVGVATESIGSVFVKDKNLRHEAGGRSALGLLGRVEACRRKTCR